MPTYILKIAAVFMLSITVLICVAEGTKQLNPSFGDHGIMQIYDQKRTSYTYDAPLEERLHITVCEVGEIIHIGINQSNTDVVYRLRAPNDSIVIAETACPQTGEEGYIDTYAEAVAGPREIVGAAGYDAVSYTATQTGDRKEFSFRQLMTNFFKYPFMTIKIIGSIHYEALLLWKKGAIYRKRDNKILNNLSYEEY